MLIRSARRKPPYSASRVGLAATSAAAVFAVSYGLQRLWALGTPQPDPTEAVLLGHTPFYWRCGLALLQGLVVAALAYGGLDDDDAEKVLRWAPVWLPGLVLPFALLMVAFP